VADQVGLGIVGLGRWANAHAGGAARSDSVRIVNCFARTPETREAYAAAHGVDPAVEAVIVSTPNDFHAEHVATAVAAGKPVLVDKPVSVSVAEGLGLLRTTTATGVPVGVAHHARRLAGHRAARDWIAGGAAGTVRLANGDFSNNRGAHMKPDSWHRTARGSEAGVLIQVGIHQVDVMLHLLGPALSVNARFEYRALGPSMPDAVAVTMIHASGAVSVVTSSWTTPRHYRTDILATEGNLSFRIDHRHWTSGDVDDHGELVLDPVDGERSAFPIVKGDPLRDQLDELARAARQGTPMAVDVLAGLRAVAVVEASVRSARDDGAPVTIADLVRHSGGTDAEVSLMISG
jgi:predicted dehydrogenase